MLWAILDKSWRQQLKKQQRYGYIPSITKTIQVRLCWRIWDELISDLLLWTPSHGWAKAGWPTRIYIQQLCADTGCSLEDIPEAKEDREGWWQRVREIRAGGVTCWWWRTSITPVHALRLLLKTSLRMLNLQFLLRELFVPVSNYVGIMLFWIECSNLRMFYFICGTSSCRHKLKLARKILCKAITDSPVK